ncbi:MAG: hypothetical protein GY795_48985 [Desulfobacterales bacterium]|nr:hypothetical protein [Desulfobacterales bacterium]
MKKRTLYSIIFCLAVLMVTLGCGDKIVLNGSVPDAENSLITTDGRLFVTGGENIYEYSDDEFKPIGLEGNSYLGMAEYEGSLYVLCMIINDNLKDIADSMSNCDVSDLGDIPECVKKMFTRHVLLKADLYNSDGNKKILQHSDFTEIMELEDMVIPNGMVVDDSGKLYVSDETFLPYGKIVRIDPELKTQEVWASSDECDGTSEECVVSPNGMAIKGRNIYFTDFAMNHPEGPKAQVKRINIDTKEVTLLHQRCGGIIPPFSFFDDLITHTLDYDGTTYELLVVTDFTKSSILFFEDTGSYKSEPDREEDDLGIAHPSSVCTSSANDIFPGGNFIVITEKGLMFEKNSSYGNKVSLFEMP